jgi:hypothetical protein
VQSAAWPVAEIFPSRGPLACVSTAGAFKMPTCEKRELTMAHPIHR